MGSLDGKGRVSVTARLGVIGRPPFCVERVIFAASFRRGDMDRLMTDVVEGAPLPVSLKITEGFDSREQFSLGTDTFIQNRKDFRHRWDIIPEQAFDASGGLEMPWHALLFSLESFVQFNIHIEESWIAIG